MILDELRSCIVRYKARKKSSCRLFWPPVTSDIEKVMKKYELNYKRFKNLKKMGRF